MNNLFYNQKMKKKIYKIIYKQLDYMNKIQQIYNKNIFYGIFFIIIKILINKI